MKMSSAVFSTALGWMGVAWNGCRVARITFGHRSAAKARGALESTPGVRQAARRTQPLIAQQQQLVDRLTAYAAGAIDNFLDVAIDEDHLSEFQRAVVTFCRHIPYGRTLSYAQLAARAGSPRAARAVGNVMRSNRYPLLVPCHRVVASGGIGGYSAPDGLSMKRRLLLMEAAEETRSFPKRSAVGR